MWACQFLIFYLLDRLSKDENWISFLLFLDAFSIIHGNISIKSLMRMKLMQKGRTIAEELVKSNISKRTRCLR